MKLTIAAILFAGVSAFVPGNAPVARPAFSLHEKMAEDIGIPCEDECGLESYPNMPESVHPGVLSGQAMMDLLNDAKEKGKELLNGLV
jgi:hypothetical protein